MNKKNNIQLIFEKWNKFIAEQSPWPSYLRVKKKKDSESQTPEERYQNLSAIEKEQLKNTTPIDAEFNRLLKKMRKKDSEFESKAIKKAKEISSTLRKGRKKNIFSRLDIDVIRQGLEDGLVEQDVNDEGVRNFPLIWVVESPSQISTIKQEPLKSQAKKISMLSKSRQYYDVLISWLNNNWGLQGNSIKDVLEEYGNYIVPGLDFVHAPNKMWTIQKATDRNLMTKVDEK